MSYHPQSRGQVEVSNREIKSIVAKTVNVHCTYYSSKLDDDLWTYRKTFKSPIGLSPYKLVFGKACHLPVELKRKPLWALKKINLNWDIASTGRVHQILELDEFCLKAYKSLVLYKENVKLWHDAKILIREFQVGESVLFFNSRLKLFPGKVKSWLTCLHTVTHVYGNGTIEIEDAKG
ncbi:uncharacterized protein [Solanum tuberosum]|uniref:uncharacterized protein n=1 Tax=Solanum tuberosum TaxID=4113 RepID=UPI00073A1FB7|nr:PREDICTED: uncharacterized protein LOC107057922 [Solanum tuberosum]